MKRKVKGDFPCEGKLLIPHINTSGYSQLRLAGKCFSIHRIIAVNFVPNPENKPQVNHIDGIKSNNYFKSLEWTTQSENQIHAHKIGLKDFSGERNQRAILTWEIVNSIRYGELSNLTSQELAYKFNISKSAVQKVISFQNWKVKNG